MKIAEYQIELAHHAIDCGADVIFGNHPHVLQGVEVYQGKAIFYLLGNFTFCATEPAKGHERKTAIVLNLHDCELQNHGGQNIRGRIDHNIDPHVLNLTDGKDIVDMVAHRSSDFKTRFAPHGDAIRRADACKRWPRRKGGLHDPAMERCEFPGGPRAGRSNFYILYAASRCTMFNSEGPGPGFFLSAMAC